MEVFQFIKNKEDEPIYSYDDKYIRWFAHQSFKGGRLCALSQWQKSKVFDEVLKILSEELNSKGDIYDFVEEYLNYQNTQLEIIEKEYEIFFIEYKIINEDKMEKISLKK